MSMCSVLPLQAATRLHPGRPGEPLALGHHHGGAAAAQPEQPTHPAGDPAQVSRYLLSFLPFCCHFFPSVHVIFCGRAAAAQAEQPADPAEGPAQVC